MRPGNPNSCSHPGCTLDTGHSGDHIGFGGKSCGCKNLGAKYLETVTRPVELTPEDEEAVHRLIRES